MILKKAIQGFVVLAFPAVLFVACGSPEKPDSAITDTEVTQEDVAGDANENVNKVQDIFYSVPSPMEMASLLKKAGAEYDMSLLNDVKKVNDYTTSRSQALNLGIYGANLSYASIFNQNQESIIYLSCTKKLAEKLGVTKAFDDETIERMEANIENRDSLLNIVSETYYMLDAYLKENDRDHISAMVIAAGWVEGLYMATSIAKKSETPDEKLLQRIAEQKISLQNLVELVEAYNTTGQLDEIQADLEKINNAYSQVSLEKSKATMSEGEDGVAIIGGGSKNPGMSSETLQNITKVVSEIRSNYVS